jgi:hypothetical protein
MESNQAWWFAFMKPWRQPFEVRKFLGILTISKGKTYTELSDDSSEEGSKDVCIIYMEPQELVVSTYVFESRPRKWRSEMRTITLQ